MFQSTRTQVLFTLSLGGLLGYLAATARVSPSAQAGPPRVPRRPPLARPMSRSPAVRNRAA